MEQVQITGLGQANEKRTCGKENEDLGPGGNLTDVLPHVQRSWRMRRQLCRLFSEPTPRD